MNSQFNSRTYGLVLVAVVWAFFLSAIGSPEVILFTIPVFMLAAPLALGLYAGEELIATLASMGRTSKRVHGLPRGRRIAAATSSVRGRLLIASNLAGRAPPLSFT
ncbi:MAG: hypothetical protein WBW62_00195 [Solirubrobacterales bacterium]